MSSNIINWIIDKYFKNILEIDKEHTKSSVFSGEFEMSNLKIKREIFAILNLPFFELVQGYVGKLKIKVKLPRFYLHPIKIEVEKVFFHAKQKALSNLNKESEIRNLEIFKNTQLQSTEELKCELLNMQNSGELIPGMANKIMNNFDINVTDICIRYDDDISYELIPFCLGVLIKNINVKTVDKDFNELQTKKIPFEEINHKIVKITNLSVYLDTFENEGKLIDYKSKIVDTENTAIPDEKFKNFLGPMLDYYQYCLSEMNEHVNNFLSHQYLLFNLGYSIKLSINENIKNGKPKIEVDFKLDDTFTSISLVQTKALLKLLAYQNLTLKYQLGVLKENYNLEMDENQKLEYIEKYIKYFIYMYSPTDFNENKSKKLKKELVKVEQKLCYEDIQILREAAEYKMTYNQKLADIEKKIKDIKKFTENKLLKKFVKELTPEEIQEIEKLEKEKENLESQDINQLIKTRIKKVDGVPYTQAIEIGEDVVLLKINFSMPKFFIDLNKDKTEKLLSIDLTKLEVKGSIKLKQQFFTLSINDISIKQYQLSNNLYKDLVSTLEQKKEEEMGDAIIVELQVDPSFEKSNFKIKVRNNKRFIITLNLYSILHIMEKVSNSASFLLDADQNYSNNFKAPKEIHKVIKDGFKVDFYTTRYQHINAYMDAELKSPIVVFPIDILDDTNKKCILIKCGNFSVNSVLPPRQNPNTDYTQIKERAMLFDSYLCKGEVLNISTINNFNGDLNQCLDIEGQNIVENMSINVDMDMNFEPDNPYFEKFKIALNIKKAEFNLRDAQLAIVMELLEKLKILMEKLFVLDENKTYLETQEQKLEKEKEISNKNKANDEDEDHDQNKKKRKLNYQNLIVRNIKKAREIKKMTEQIKNIFAKSDDNKLTEQLNIKNERAKNNTNNEIKNENNNNIKIYEDAPDDPKYILIDFAVEKVEFCLKKTLTQDEKNVISEINSLNNGINFNEDYLNYKDFILFELANIKLNFFVSEQGNISITNSTQNANINNMEKLITNSKNTSEDLFTSPELQTSDKINDNNYILSLPIKLEDIFYLIKIGYSSKKIYLIFHIEENSFLPNIYYESRMTIKELNKISKYFEQIDTISEAIEVLKKNWNLFNKRDTGYKIILGKVINKDNLNIQMSLLLANKEIDNFNILCQKYSYNDKQIVSNAQKYFKDLKTDDPKLYKMMTDYFNNKNCIYDEKNGLDSLIINNYNNFSFINKKVKEKLKKSEIKYKLIYRASRDGDTVENFYKKCSNISPIILIIKTKESNLNNCDKNLSTTFGFFLTKFLNSCKKTNDKIKDDLSFCFQIDNQKIYDIIPGQEALYKPKESKCLLQLSCNGMIYISNEFLNSNENKVGKAEGNSYYGMKKDFELNNGKQNFRIIEMEIFAVE